MSWSLRGSRRCDGDSTAARTRHAATTFGATSANRARHQHQRQRQPLCLEDGDDGGERRRHGGHWAARRPDGRGGA